MGRYKGSAAAMLLVVLLVAGCGFKDQRVSLTYDTIVGAAGASGEIFIAGPRERQTTGITPGGARILGRVNGTEGAVVTGNSVDAWFLNALEKELSVEVWKEGRLVKIVSVSAGSEDKGIDHSAGHLSYLLMNTLQNAMKNIVPDLMKALEG